MATSEQQTTLGDVVRVRREELGLSKTELARRARLTRSSIHEIEAGQRRHLQARTLRSLDDALELPAGTLERRLSKVLARVFVSHSLADSLSSSLRDELQDALGERRYETLLVVLLKVAEKLDEIEQKLDRSA